MLAPPYVAEAIYLRGVCECDSSAFELYIETSPVIRLIHIDGGSFYKINCFFDILCDHKQIMVLYETYEKMNPISTYIQYNLFLKRTR